MTPSPSSSSCPVCGATRIETILTWLQIPVFCNQLWPEQDAARAAPRGDMELALCQDCGHLFNRAFDAGLTAYDPTYENSLHFSPTFQSYARSLAQRLVESYDLRGKAIIEIGCGQGDFLRLLCELGNNRGVGFDPSYEDEGELAPHIRIIPDYYSERYAHIPADFFCSRHVIEHLPQPRAFASMLHRAMSKHTGAALFIEAPNADYMLAHTALWDVIYEHFSYFGRDSMQRLFQDEGFEVTALYSTFGGQYLCLEAEASKAQVSRSDAGEQRTERARAFGREGREVMARWRDALAALARAGRRTVVWGAGSKGVMFLNLLQPQSDFIEYVVDINPRKQGMFVAGAGQTIVPPEFLRNYRPDVILLMNRNYEKEIREMAAGLGLSPEFLLV